MISQQDHIAVDLRQRLERVYASRTLVFMWLSSGGPPVETRNVAVRWLTLAHDAISTLKAMHDDRIVPSLAHAALSAPFDAMSVAAARLVTAQAAIATVDETLKLVEVQVAAANRNFRERKP